MEKIDLNRFVEEQKDDYQTALGEIKSGRKKSHWMWYIFPQIAGLGRSSTAQYYSIKNLEEAKAFLEDPYLGDNLKEITKALLGLEGNDPVAVFGSVDSMKLKSSMTLFGLVSEEGSIFQQVLDKYYGGEGDQRTVEITSQQSYEE